ncbi:MAG: hypothetical protein ACLBM1_14745 [Cuspidothrix sp.]|nr:hypothetical protein [Cuspidothrix issatschenkoi]MBE9233135.1 hypothetical protein [Cuspidothrix issatschenkoi LEGE 03284]
MPTQLNKGGNGWITDVTDGRFGELKIKNQEFFAIFNWSQTQGDYE